MPMIGQMGGQVPARGLIILEENIAILLQAQNDAYLAYRP